jgi:DNA-directed RNA polymerase subunit M/transcription elongation factor TFIIS
MAKKTITICPKCGSELLWYKPDGSIQCMRCNAQYKKEETAICKKKPSKKSAT